MIHAALLIGDGLRYLGYILSPLLLFPLIILVLPRARRYAHRPVWVIESISNSLLNIAGWTGLIMAVGMLAAVILRYVYGVSFGWLKDIWIYAFASCFLLASAHAIKSDSHVRVDIFYAGLTHWQKAVVNIIGFYVLLLPLMVLILHAYAPHLARAWGASGRLELASEADGLPLAFLFKTLPPIFAVTMIVQGWTIAIRSACTLVRQPMPALPVTTQESMPE